MKVLTAIQNKDFCFSQQFLPKIKLNLLHKRKLTKPCLSIGVLYVVYMVKSHSYFTL